MTDMEGQQENSTGTSRTTGADMLRAIGFAAAIGAAMIALAAVTVLVLARPDVRGKDFLATGELAQLKQQFALDPKNTERAEQIRRLDLDLRQRYFTHLTMARYGNWLLLACLAAFVVSIKAAMSLRRPRPKIGPKHPDFQGEMRRATGRRVAVSALAAVLIAGALTPAAIEAYLRATTVPPPPPHIADQALAATYWPQFRGPGSQGRGVYDNVPLTWNAPAGENVLWRSPVALPGKSSPVVWGGRIFLTGGTKDAREITCYDANTGSLLWSTAVEDLPGSPVQIKEPSEDTGWAAATPVCDDRRVAAIFANGDLACLDRDGKIVWAQALGAPVKNYGHGSSLAIWRNLVFVLWDQGAVEEYMSKIFAFDINTGRIVWQKRRPVAASWATPTLARIGETDQLLTVSDPWMISYRPATGEELWRARTLEGSEVASSPVAAGGVAYSICAETYLAAVRADGEGDVTESKLLWESNKGLTDITSPVTDGELLWTIETGGTLTCFDAKTGGVIYEQEMAGSYNASPSLCAGKLWLINLKGRMFVCEAGREFKLLHTNELGEPAYASPVFQDGRVYLRGRRNLTCIAAGAQSPPMSQPAPKAQEGDGEH